FFMVNWEGLRERKALTLSPSVPLAAERNGDFSANPAIIYDPATRVFDGAGKVIVAPRPFDGNIIPPERINPVSRKLLDYFPLPQINARAANFVNNEGRRGNAGPVTLPPPPL